MKLYSGKKVDYSIERRFRKHRESRDGIVWDVDTNSQLARIKIQGSDEYIYCHFAQNWETQPHWVKPGMAVRVIHKGGNKVMREAAGYGRAIPTPIAGSQLPPQAEPPDQIISGGNATIVGTSSEGGAIIQFGSMTYRIDGITYILDCSEGGLSMDETSPPMAMGDSPVIILGTGNCQVTLSPPPAQGLFRYDLFAIGTDGIIDVIEGSETAEPAMPATPNYHVKITHMLIIGGTAATNADINRIWEARKAQHMTIIFTSLTGTIINENEFEWSLTYDTPVIKITITLYDQYNWKFDFGGGDLILTLLLGTGWISTGSSGPWYSLNDPRRGPPVSVSKNGVGNDILFYYSRNQLAVPIEYSPVFSVDYVGDINLTLFGEKVTLIDVSGLPRP